jgi:hypothetical protein
MGAPPRRGFQSAEMAFFKAIGGPLCDDFGGRSAQMPNTWSAHTADPHHRVVASPPSAKLTPWLGRAGHHPIKPKRNRRRRRRGPKLGLDPAPRSAPPRQGIKSTIPPARNLGARTRRTICGRSGRSGRSPKCRPTSADFITLRLTSAGEPNTRPQRSR